MKTLKSFIAAVLMVVMIVCLSVSALLRMRKFLTTT